MVTNQGITLIGEINGCPARVTLQDVGHTDYERIIESNRTKHRTKSHWIGPRTYKTWSIRRCYQARSKDGCPGRRPRVVRSSQSTN